jgi:diacylglycerol kinase (ATP)
MSADLDPTGQRANPRTRIPLRIEEVLLAAVLVPLALFLPASGPGRALMVGSVMLVLVVELLNSAVEATVDRVSLDDHSLAKRAKDIGSAAVMVALLNVPVTWVLVLFG